MPQGAIHLFLLAAASLPIGLFNAAFLPGLESLLSLGALAIGFALWGRGFCLGPAS